MPKSLRFIGPLLALLGSLGSGAFAASTPRPAFAVVDLHVDLSYQYNFKGQEFAAEKGQFSERAMRAGGVTGVVLPLFVPRDASPSGPRSIDLETSYERVSKALRDTPGFSAPGCFSDGRGVRTFFAFEGAGPLADNPESLEGWAGRGLRIVGLVHTYANELASSSGDATPKAFGLTERGRAFVRRAFALGLLVDVSHASDHAVTDILALAKEAHGVVIATHSNARALCDQPRNLTDEQLRAIAATGGVIGVNFHGPFLVRGRRAQLSDVVAQVQHLRDVAGIDHVAIGSDFEGDIRPPKELADASRFPKLSAALAKAGFDEASIRKVFSENALRVLCPSASPSAKRPSFDGSALQSACALIERKIQCPRWKPAASTHSPIGSAPWQTTPARWPRCWKAKAKAARNAARPRR